MAIYDFGGYATKNDLLCADGRVIRNDAFKEQDGEIVPLVWSHHHDDPSNVLGHALLENREDGVYAYGAFNDTEKGRIAKMLVDSGDITKLSIYANQLKQSGRDVMHGVIREVSVVLAGANPGACIDSLSIAHSIDEPDLTEGVIYTDDDIVISSERVDVDLKHSGCSDDKKDDTDKNTNLEHSKEEPDKTKDLKEKIEKKMKEPQEDKADMAKERTVKDVFDEITEKLTEDEMNVIYYLIGEAAKNGVAKDEKEADDVKHNVFDAAEQVNDMELIHDAMGEILKDGKKYGTLKESFLAHADNLTDLGYTVSGSGNNKVVTPSYGIGNVDYLFPDNRNITDRPEMIQRDTNWVNKFMNGVHRSPFSRIKSLFADITEDEARAKGYIKGKMKKDEIFGLLKRTTNPTTVYKKQKMDRDDVVDITDFDVVAWLKSEMRVMLDEELARAMLIGDQRPSSDDDKIDELCIRPIYTDADFFTIKQQLTMAADADDDTQAKAFIKAAVKARKNYKGSGNPTLYTTEDMLTKMLLLEDGIGHRLYDSTASLATAMRVKDIQTVEVMEGVSREVSGTDYDLWGIIVNPADYNVGADKGGAINMFDDFDIDYNQQKYLIETRCSGALIKPYSAIVIEATEAVA